MKILSMTATFGKLDHASLSFRDGLNLLEAPNEWGKTTWCAFFVNMLYGLDTRAKSTKTALAQKDRYAPWSGAPMAGRIELDWEGKKITVERSTQGRTPLGTFRAYETDTGLEIPELTGANCGLKLLGVERSVFERAGFLRLQDLPLTPDEALRRRLNNLVTTGDESGAGDRLAKSLKELKNKCRFNRTGLLPQAEAQREALLSQLEELQAVGANSQRMSARLEALHSEIQALENHQAALDYAAALQTHEKVETARQELEEKAHRYAKLERLCARQPSRQEAEASAAEGHRLQNAVLELQLQAPPAAPEAPDLPTCYRDREEGLGIVENTRAEWAQATQSKKSISPLPWILSALGLLFLVFSLILGGKSMIWGLCLGIPGAALLISGLWLWCQQHKARREQEALRAYYLQKYAPLPPEVWVAEAEKWEAALGNYQKNLEKYQEEAVLHSKTKKRLMDQVYAYAPEGNLQETCANWEQICANWAQLAAASEALNQAQAHLEALEALETDRSPAGAPDSLTISPEETEARLTFARREASQIEKSLAKLQGRADVLGQEAPVRAQLKALEARISRLEETYAALELAQNALSSASAELQRRFAPRIAKAAQDFFAELTNGRYQRLALNEDLTLRVEAEQEDLLRPSLWRSDGTVDALYLALRLAVAQELAPEAPLILDDALVRLDEKRLKNALTLLSRLGKTKQILLFTCSGREKRILEGENV